MASEGLHFALLDGSSLDLIPPPARPGARCQTCDYWERLDGAREHDDSIAARDRKRARLLAGAVVSGAYAMLAQRAEEVVGFAQFGPLSAYPRAQVIRDRYPALPDAPPPWVITCLQVVPGLAERAEFGSALLEAVCADLDRRGVTAVEAYPEPGADGWLAPPGPAGCYRAAGFAQAAGDERFPVYRRELTGSGADIGWGDLLRHAPPADDSDAWPLPLPKGPGEDDVFRLPPKPTRPNPFGDD